MKKRPKSAQSAHPPAKGPWVGFCNSLWADDETPSTLVQVLVRSDGVVRFVAMISRSVASLSCTSPPGQQESEKSLLFALLSPLCPLAATVSRLAWL
jgi:hypothetical protein